MGSFFIEFKLHFLQLSLHANIAEVSCSSDFCLYAF